MRSTGAGSLPGPENVSETGVGLGAIDGAGGTAVPSIVGIAVGLAVGVDEGDALYCVGLTPRETPTLSPWAAPAVTEDARLRLWR